MEEHDTNAQSNGIVAVEERACLAGGQQSPRLLHRGWHGEAGVGHASAASLAGDSGASLQIRRRPADANTCACLVLLRVPFIAHLNIRCMINKR